MNRLRRFFTWFAEQPTYTKLSVVGSTLLVIILAAIIVRSAMDSNANVEAAEAAKEAPPIEYVASITAVAPPVPITAEDMESNSAALYPVKVIPVTEYLRLVESTPEGLASDAVVNGITGVTAAMFGTDESAVVNATQFVPQQTDALLAAYESAGLDVTVSSAAARTTSGVYPRGYYPPAAGASPYVAAGGSNYAQLVLMVMLGMVAITMLVFVLTNLRRRRAAAAQSSSSAGTLVNASGGKSAAEDNIPTVRFADVAGCEEAIDELQEIAEYLKDPTRYEITGARGAKGALLCGPPGTGKTLLARAVAGEAGVPFFAASGSDFVEMYVGVGAKRVRELFAKARKFPAAIIFIDEIDAVGRQRGGNGERGNQEHENTLNALLVELDGFAKTNIVVIGATNRDDLLDKALLRPGRLDRKVHVPLPDRGGREKILAVHAEGKPLASDVVLANVAKRTPGMSGADLASLVNEAAVFAARAGQTEITAADFDQAIATLAMGKARKSAIISDDDKKLTAWHEAGHAVCGLAQPDAVNPVAVSIVPRGHAGGVTWFPGHDSGYMTRKAAYAELVTAMGGMAAEQLLLGDGEFTTGPSGDLQAASQRALDMVTQRGMGEWLLVRSEGILGAASESTEDAVKEANTLMHKALDDAKTLLQENRELFDAMVAALIEYEDIGLQQIEELVAHRPVTAPTTPPPAPRQPVKAATAPVEVVRPGKARRQRPRVKELVGAVSSWSANRSKRRRTPA